MGATGWRALSGLVLTVIFSLVVSEAGQADPGRASTEPADALPVCGADVAAPCIASLLRDGRPADPAIYSAIITPSSAHGTGFAVTKAGKPDLGLAELTHTFTVTVDTGALKPRIVSGSGINGRAVRIYDGDGTWHVRVTLEPADMLAACDAGPTNCPSAAPLSTWVQRARVRIDDGSWYSEGGGNPEALTGLDLFSNIDSVKYPPTISTGRAQSRSLDLVLQNSHFYPDGTTVFYGRANLRLPTNVLRDLFGIPDPRSMTSASFVASTTSGTVSAGPIPGGDAWDVELDAMTFSKQRLRLQRGLITPTKPTGVRAVRVSGRKGLIFGSSSPRGALVTGYVVRCVSGGYVASGSSATSPVPVTRLRANRAYRCQLTARSAAGNSRPTGVGLAARP